MSDIDLLKRALLNVVKSGHATVQSSAAFVALWNEIVKLEEEHRDALRNASS